MKIVVIKALMQLMTRQKHSIKIIGWKEMYNNTIEIGFAGFCKTDIILYMSRILFVLGEKVAIVDRTAKQELRFSVPVGIYSEDRLDYRGVDIFLGCEKTSLKTLPLKEYSVVLVDFGVNHKTFEDIKDTKVLFIVTDCQRHHTVPLSIWLNDMSFCVDSIRIIRDTVYGKIRPRYIDSLLQAGQVTKLIAKYEFAFSEFEYAHRLQTQYDDIFKFNKIPDVFRSMLLDCITELFGADRKTALKAIRKAQIGG